MPVSHHRGVRSFVVRAGRMTDGQRRALEMLWPRYGLEYSPAVLDLDTVFGRRARRVLEIGSGNGEHLARMAAASPDTDFIGVEVHPPGIGHLLQMAENSGLVNLRAIRHDGMEVLEQQIAEGSLDAVLVLFPDPWPKKRHHKRRLVDARFARLVASRLKAGGTLKLATDWEPYAEQMLEVLGAEPRLANRAGAGYMSRDPARAPTRFEQRGTRLGHAVRDLEFVRLEAPAGGG
jgi:tRNA (guanine-N7-)-methyltransferase